MKKKENCYTVPLCLHFLAAWAKLANFLLKCFAKTKGKPFIIEKLSSLSLRNKTEYIILYFA
jgi:hypothetical protein